MCCSSLADLTFRSALFSNACVLLLRPSQIKSSNLLSFPVAVLLFPASLLQIPVVGLLQCLSFWHSLSSLCVFQFGLSGMLLIQISGLASAVKKALLSVSSCLQDNPRGDAAYSGAFKPSGILHGTVPPPHVDPFSQWGYTSGLYAPFYSPQTA